MGVESRQWIIEDGPDERRKQFQWERRVRVENHGDGAWPAGESPYYIHLIGVGGRRDA